jgi:hypothetical protein
MKTSSHKVATLARTTAVLGLAVITIFLPHPSTALTITDSFTNSVNWGSPFTESGKNLAVANGRMNFTSSTTGGGGAGLMRNTPFLTTTQDWSIKVDVHINPFTITDDAQSVSVFLGVGKTSDYLGTHVLLGFDRDSYDPNYYGVNDDVQTNGVSVAGMFNVNFLPSPDATLRLDHNAAAHTITYYLDSDGSTGGSGWTLLGTMNLASGPYDLHLATNDTLNVFLAGWSELQVVTAGQAYLDNLEITVVDTGSLQVTISPTNAVSAGAQWQVDGGAWQNNSNTVSDLSAGNHTVSYQAISGWNTPTDQTVVVAAGGTTATNGIYTPQTGSLQVTISPLDAANAGAQWQVDGGAWRNSGTTVGDLPVGNHTVAYKTISGWNTPTNQTVLVAANTTSVTNGTYVQQTGSLVVTIDPANAVTAGAQWQVDDGAWQNSGAVISVLLAGNHTVSFKNIPDWITPVSQWVFVAPNSTATANGVYLPSGQPVQPPVMNCSLQGGYFTMTYPVFPGQAYILQYTDDLTPPVTWRPVLPFMGLPTSPITLAVPTGGAPCRYFRIRVGDSSEAVYSVNIVGYVRRVIQPGLNLVANPLNSCSDNSIASLFPNCPPNSEILLPAPDGSFDFGSGFSGGTWDPPNLNLLPGQGVGFVNPAAAFEVTFAGEVAVGSLTNSLSSGLSLVSSVLPVNGLLNFPAQEDDEITTWNSTNQTPVNHAYLGGAWQPASPAISPAEAFWVQVSQFKQWTQPFEPWNDLEVWDYPIITRQPENLTTPQGNTAHFTVQVLGGLPLHYQWRRDGTNLLNSERVLGATTNTLALTNAQPGDPGNYSVVITNSYGSVTSSVATLTIQVLPLIIVSTNGSFGVSNGIFGFNLSGAPGQTLVTEVSTNLSVWLPLKTNTLTTDSVYFSDPQWTNFPGRFYRIRSP